MERLLSHSPLAYTGALASYAVQRSPPSSCTPLPPIWVPLCPLKGGAPPDNNNNSPPFLGLDKPKHWFSPLHVSRQSLNSPDDCFPFGNSLDQDIVAVESSTALIRRGDLESCSLVVAHVDSLEALSQDMAMGLALRAASGTGWTTGSGLEGPSSSFDLNRDKFAADVGDQPWPWLSKSPRRRMRVAFTCNVCGERTTRAINPHAYTDGTVFVQCAGCNIFHKLVDNLNLFHELKGGVFPGYGETRFSEHQPYDFLGLDDLSHP